MLPAEEAEVFVRASHGSRAATSQRPIRRSRGSGRPGLEGAKRLLMLIAGKNGRGLGLTFFDTEEDMRRGDEALNSMNPDSGEQRTSVEMYEVGITTSSELRRPALGEPVPEPGCRRRD